MNTILLSLISTGSIATECCINDWLFSVADVALVKASCARPNNCK